MASLRGIVVRARRFPHRLRQTTGRRALASELRRLTSTPFPRCGSSDLRSFNVSDHLEFRVMWIDRLGELGPTFSVFTGAIEAFRADLFEANPHAHPIFATAIPLGRAGQRYALPERSVEQHIDWLCWELENNLGYHLAFHPLHADPRDLEPTAAQLERGVEWTRRQLTDLVAAHG